MKIIDRYLIKHGFVKQDMVQKSAGFMPLETAAYPQGKPDQDKIADYGEFIRAYRNLPWLYAGATTLAIAATKPTLRIYREIKDGADIKQVEVVGEDINRLIELPNPDLSYRELIQISVVNLWLLGNQYWNLVGTRENMPLSKTNRPVEIWWVKPEQIQPEPDANGAIQRYVFKGPTGREKSLNPSEIIHFRQANPGSYFLGMGAMEPLTATATLEFNAMTFQRGFLENDGTPPLLLESPGEMNPDQRKRFWTAWDERHKGPKKAGRAGLIWGGMKPHLIGSSLKDAQYPELRKMNREEFLACLGMPPSVVGLLEYANYSNMEVQQKKLWEDAVMPTLGIFADKLTLRLAPLFDDRIWFEYDYSNIKVLQEDEERQARVANMLISSGLKTPNQIRAEMFNAEPYEGGDQYYMSFSLAPVGADAGAKERAAKRLKAIEGREEAPGGDGPKVSFWRVAERKRALWTSFERRLSASERAFAPEVEKFLHAQADQVKKALAKFESSEAVRAGRVFDIEDEAKKYSDKFESRYRAVFERAGEAGVHATKGKIWIPPEERRIKEEGDEFQVLAEHLKKLRHQIELSAGYFNETIWEKIKKAIEDAQLAGKTIEELTQDVWAKLEELAPSHARLIAHTEMNRVENWGQTEGYKQTEYVDHKGWLCSMVEDSRPEHIAADGQEVALNEDFDVNHEPMAYPGDQRGSAGNVCNCLCTTYPVVSI